MSNRTCISERGENKLEPDPGTLKGLIETFRQSASFILRSLSLNLLPVSLVGRPR